MKPDHVLGVTACACCLIVVASLWAFVSSARGLAQGYSPASGIPGVVEVQDASAGN
jgi:hypothetical protein